MDDERRNKVAITVIAMATSTLKGSLVRGRWGMRDETRSNSDITVKGMVTFKLTVLSLSTSIIIIAYSLTPDHLRHPPGAHFVGLWRLRAGRGHRPAPDDDQPGAAAPEIRILQSEEGAAGAAQRRVRDAAAGADRVVRGVLYTGHIG